MNCYRCEARVLKLADDEEARQWLSEHGRADCQLGQCEKCKDYLPVGCRCGETFDRLLVVHLGWSNQTPTGSDYQLVQCRRCAMIYLRKFWQSKIDWTGCDDEFEEWITSLSLTELAELLVNLEEKEARNSWSPRQTLGSAVEFADRLGNRALAALVRDLRSRGRERL
jgi:hypothetical protein